MPQHTHYGKGSPRPAAAIRQPNQRLKASGCIQVGATQVGQKLANNWPSSHELYGWPRCMEVMLEFMSVDRVLRRTSVLSVGTQMGHGTR
jgi:hypothetical protein